MPRNAGFAPRGGYLFLSADDLEDQEFRRDRKIAARAAVVLRTWIGACRRSILVSAAARRCGCHVNAVEPIRGSRCPARPQHEDEEKRAKEGGPTVHGAPVAVSLVDANAFGHIEACTGLADSLTQARRMILGST